MGRPTSPRAALCRERITTAGERLVAVHCPACRGRPRFDPHAIDAAGGVVGCLYCGTSLLALTESEAVELIDAAGLGWARVDLSLREALALVAIS